MKNLKINGRILMIVTVSIAYLPDIPDNTVVWITTDG